jgi:hypothetical protein
MKINASIPPAKYRRKKSFITYSLHGFSPEMLIVCTAEGYVSSAHTCHCSASYHHSYTICRRAPKVAIYKVKIWRQ